MCANLDGEVLSECVLISIPKCGNSLSSRMRSNSSHLVCTKWKCLDVGRGVVCPNTHVYDPPPLRMRKFVDLNEHTFIHRTSPSK